MSPVRRLLHCATLALFFLPRPSHAHPEPDIPVRASFNTGGAAVITVELDLRCFTDNPKDEPYTLKWVLDEMDEAEREKLRTTARRFIEHSIEFYFEPLGLLSPHFSFTFAGLGGNPLQEIEDVVTLIGKWETTLPADVEGYRISSAPDNKLSVLFLNEIAGEKVERIHVLFPGESSYLLDLTSVAPAPEHAKFLLGRTGANVGENPWTAFSPSIRRGFGHVLPFALDHILFVLAVYLLSRKWRPLLWQFLILTLAHTVALAVATLDLFRLPLGMAAPVIAGCILGLAVENIFHRRFTGWRLLVVFAFGFVHALDLARFLAERELPPRLLFVDLLGFNLGVEAGQLIILAVALLATAWLRKPEPYRKLIVIPASAAIAAIGIFWLAQIFISSA